MGVQASTGPRSRGRGWTAVRDSNGVVTNGFNGAALTGARMEKPSKPGSPPSLSLQRGRAHGGADGLRSGTMLVGSAAASTGPRSRGRGWGVHQAPYARNLEGASTGPRSRGRGWAQLESPCPGRRGASTGPRSRGRGWGGGSAWGGRTFACFNGAALTGARMDFGQLGAGVKETVASTGPRSRGRGWTLGALTANKHQRSASTGPRSRGRGWLKTFLIYACDAFRFNGAALRGRGWACLSGTVSRNRPLLQRGRAHGGAEWQPAEVEYAAMDQLQRGRAHGGADGCFKCTPANVGEDRFNGAALKWARNGSGASDPYSHILKRFNGAALK